MKSQLIVAVFLTLMLNACQYGDPVWQSRIENGVSDPAGNISALSLHSTLYRWPKGFVAQFPDGGKPKVLKDESTIFILDRQKAALVKTTKIARPKDIRGAFSLWVISLDEHCELLFKLTGTRGETSDTPFVMRTFAMNACNPESQPIQVERSTVQGPLSRSVTYTSTEVTMSGPPKDVRWKIVPSGSLEQLPASEQ